MAWISRSLPALLLAMTSFFIGAFYRVRVTMLLRCYGAPCANQVARYFRLGFGCGIRLSSSRRIGIFSSMRSEMRLHTLRHSSTMVASAVR